MHNAWCVLNNLAQNVLLSQNILTLRPPYVIKKWPQAPSLIRYNLITKSLLQNVCLILASLPIGFVSFFVSVSFLACLHDVSLRNRTRAGPARSLFVLSHFLSQPPFLAFSHTHTHTHTFISNDNCVSNSPFRHDMYVCMCVYVYLYINRCRQRS